MLLVLRICILLVLEGFFLSLQFRNLDTEISYFQTSTIAYDLESTQTTEIAFVDSISGGTLYQVVNQEKELLFYYSKIRTGVCYDNKCRPLDISVYWNITGRYLGFVLPEDEFLSKYDHEPFTPAEYERLNMLLADSLLPLGNVAFEELVQNSESNQLEGAQVDGLSGATSQKVLNFVVEGAAYTTYKLWNIIYGSSHDLVESLTKQQLSSELICEILDSPDLGDKFWALNQVDRHTLLTTRLKDRLLKLIDASNYSLSVATLDAIDTSMLTDDIQMRLLTKFENSSYNIKILILNKLKSAPVLSHAFITSSAQQLQSLNGKALDEMLMLYRIKHINNIEVIKKIADLLSVDNRFVSQRAYDFLRDINVKDSTILKKISDYSSN